MFTVENYTGSLEEKYATLQRQLKSLIEDEPNQIANLSNASALLNVFLERINWVGFYLAEGDTLILGPFQGLPACIRIPFGKGVCGKAAKEQTTIVVDDVHQFPGHIACDSASRSEIVIPIFKDGKIFGILDIDSPDTDRFTAEEAGYLESFAKTLETCL
ncbi:MAG: GAF domain-containing protein [Bacillus sp. (in: firmicutes)]